jgi:hypothetical protein
MKERITGATDRRRTDGRLALRPAETKNGPNGPFFSDVPAERGEIRPHERVPRIRLQANPFESPRKPNRQLASLRKRKCPLARASNTGGERGIRTPDRRLTYTRFPGVRLKPLIHLSGGRAL